MQEKIKSYLQNSISVKEALLRDSLSEIEQAGKLAAETLASGGKLLLCGNGGSSSDASHIAAELLIRYKSGNERRALPALALSADSAALTACGNDYGFADLFARQVEGLGNKGDLLIGITTSGNSENILRALSAAKAKDMKTVLLSGQSGGRIAKDHSKLLDARVLVPSEVTSHIQECHIAIGHIFCAMIEERLFGLK